MGRRLHVMSGVEAIPKLEEDNLPEIYFAPPDKRIAGCDIAKDAEIDIGKPINAVMACDLLRGCKMKTWMRHYGDGQATDGCNALSPVVRNMKLNRK